MCSTYTPAVVQYLGVVRQVVTDVFAFHSQLLATPDTDTDTPPSSSSVNTSTAITASASGTMKSQLESTRQSYMGNLLTDVELCQGGEGGGESDQRASTYIYRRMDTHINTCGYIIM
jgi:hypothetical protein